MVLPIETVEECKKVKLWKMRRPFNPKDPHPQITISNCLHQVYICGEYIENHEPNSILIAIHQSELNFRPIPNTQCLITKEEAIRYVTDSMDVYLRPDIFQRLILTHLQPEEFNWLKTLFPSEHLLSGNFYLTGGHAQQPKDGGLPETFWYVPQKVRNAQKEILNQVQNPELESSIKLS